MEVNLPSGFTLLEGEKPEWHGRMSWKATWLLLLLGLLTIWFLIGIVFFVLAWLTVISSEYFMTNRRLYAKYGLISRRIFEIKNDWITGTMTSQGIIERLLSYGNIVISTPGQLAGSVILVGVDNPTNLRTTIEDVLQRFKKAEEIRGSRKKLEEEYKLGRLDKEKFEDLKREYETQLTKL